MESAAEKGTAGHDEAAHDSSHEHGHEPTTKLGKWMHFLQVNAIPLLLGIVIALIWANADPASYERIVGAGPTAIRPFGQVRGPTLHAWLREALILRHLSPLACALMPN